MGASSVKDMVSYAKTDTALWWHLTCNHYPPLPTSLLPVAKRAIAKANRGEYDAKVFMGKGKLTFRGRKSATVAELVESMHLQEFIEEQE